MTKKMLIDATHEEETRVAIVDGNLLEEFDYESKVRKQIKGGIYLAKVTRVEPSLQAAFVNYGGNRHGFLPFSEIHPDYFRIPISDREALLAEQKAAFDQENEDGEEEDSLSDQEQESDLQDSDEDEDDSEEDAVVEVGGADKPAAEDDSDLEAKAALKAEAAQLDEIIEADEGSEALEADELSNENSDNEQDDEESSAEEGSQSSDRRHNGRNRNRRRGRRSSMRRKKDSELVDEEDGGFRFNLRNKYKIQEVIKRGQIMLVQVSKEERGNKGAAVSTYLSLPGRYCVLMPNSPRGGGVSRKIANFQDRKKMREILKDLTIPDGMSVILRTAGVSRTKQEIKRDLDYLIRLWNTIREDTLKSSAPALINEEGNLIKRSIRDLYTKDIEEIIVSGEEGYKTAKEFMKMLVPSHAKKITEYKEDRVPLFHKYKVEQQISEIGQMTVTLKSGGYLVINPTEALVSVDVNSGRATKERHIEETALKTNLEAASEVARQLRLRDLGGLVVIDFIDMEDRRNNRKVENRLRDALSEDRARIQVGRISSFGLLELSRQRLNPSLTEAQFQKCDHCLGTGFVKTLDFAAITALRALVEEGIKGKVSELSLNLPNKVAVYILNNKRQMLADIEQMYQFRVHIRTDEALRDSEFRLDVIAKHDIAVDEPLQREAPEQGQADAGEDKPRKSRRRGRRGGRRHNKNRDNEILDQEPSRSGEDQEWSGPASDLQDNNQPVQEKTDQRKSNRAPAKEKIKDQPVLKDDVKKESKEMIPAPSNDPKPKVEKAQRVKDFEVVNEAPEKKKKGWWNRFIDNG